MQIAFAGAVKLALEIGVLPRVLGFVVPAVEARALLDLACGVQRVLLRAHRECIGLTADGVETDQVVAAPVFPLALVNVYHLPRSRSHGSAEPHESGAPDP